MRKRFEKSNVVGFDEVVPVRIMKSDKRDIEKIILRDSTDRYDSVSHFVRCAIRKLKREEMERLRL